MLETASIRMSRKMGTSRIVCAHPPAVFASYTRGAFDVMTLEIATLIPFDASFTILPITGESRASVKDQQSNSGQSDDNQFHLETRYDDIIKNNNQQISNNSLVEYTYNNLCFRKLIVCLPESCCSNCKEGSFIELVLDRSEVWIQNVLAFIVANLYVLKTNSRLFGTKRT